MKLPVIVGLVILASLSQVTVSSAAHAADHKVRPVAREEVGRTPTSRLARTDRALLGRADAELIPVLVKLDHDPVASYRGGITGFEPTSPAFTGRRLSGDAAELAYEQYLEQREGRFTDLLAKNLPQAKVGQRFRTVYGGMALSVPANQVKDLLTLDGVVAVQKDELRQPLTDSSSEFIGADRVQQDQGGGRRAGKGVTVGILDTGAWPEHPSFADQGNLGSPPGKKRPCDFGSNEGRAFKCNNKLVSGEAFLESYLSVHKDETFKSARDSDGHGTHTASTAVGNVLNSAKVFGVERGPVRGVAPAAWLSVYKVCGAKGCMSSDSAAAVAQAIRDGVNVINYSISGGTDPFTDPVEMAFLDAYAAGVFVAASAGNSGPGESTVNHLAPWVTTVAASTQRREFSSTLTLGNGAKFEGASVTAGVGPAPVVRNGKCLEPAKPSQFNGKIVLCERGGNARVEKGWNVKRGGAVGMILYNPSLQDTETDNHWLPAVHLPDASILDKLGDDPVATIGAGDKSTGKGDVMAGFSSRGPGGLALKPDVTAPGVQILAGHTPEPDEITGGPPGQLFQAIAGTSMSSPHVAGAAALLAARRPDWTPGELKSALMTTAVTDVVKEDLKTPADPLDFGAGRIAVDKAARPGVTISESAGKMLDLADDEVRSVDLNLPSINAPIMPGRLQTTRVLRNDSSQALTYRARSTDGSITVTPATVTIGAGKTASIQITISSRANDAKWRFGSVRLASMSGSYPDLHLPVAYRPTQGRVALSSSCDQSKVTMGESVKCRVQASNLGYEDASVTVKSEAGPALKLNTPASQRADLVGVTPGLPALSKLEDRRYKPLSVDADPIGDEELIVYDVPAFTYAGQSYQRIGVVSNGYLVVGGGSVQDVRSEPPSGISETRPNNVLAPYWADMDGTGAAGIRVATVQAEGREWVVVEWRVKLFGTDQEQHFQAWLATGDSERIRFAYDEAALPNGAKTFAVGAENALGKGELQSVAPGPDMLVKTSGSRPGGTVDYSLTVTGVAPSADAAVTTSMDSDGVPGTTVIHTKLPVIGRH